LNALRVSAKETIFVGDTLEADVDGAKAVGMKAVYIVRRAEEGNILPDVTIKSLSELPSVLKQLLKV